MDGIRVFLLLLQDFAMEDGTSFLQMLLQILPKSRALPAKPLVYSHVV